MTSGFWRYSITTTPIGLNLLGAKKLVIRFETADVQVSNDKGGFGGESYYTVPSGTQLIFDADPITGIVPIDEILWMQTAAGTATVSVWRMG